MRPWSAVIAAAAACTLCACSDNDGDATDAAGDVSDVTDTASCPGAASSCTAPCGAWTARRIDAARKCLGPSETVTCLEPTSICTGALTCLVRAEDDAAFWFPGDCHRPGWRACSESETAGTSYSSPPCP